MSGKAGTFWSGGLELYYEEYGSGVAVVLIHGFASNIQTNWIVPGWVDHLARQFRVIAFDLRGHGRSAKPHDSSFYTKEAFVGDVIALLDHLKIDKSFILGYSLGGRIALDVIIGHPERLKGAVLGGVGKSSGISDDNVRKKIVEALLVPRVDEIDEELPRRFRRFAEANKNDLRALAACMAVPRKCPHADELKRITKPVLVVAGENDTWVGSPQYLAENIPHARLLILEGRDHMTAVGDRRFKEAAVNFFCEIESA